jgi:hypothetical protein
LFFYRTNYLAFLKVIISDAFINKFKSLTMKKMFFALLVCVLCTLSLSAQVQKGDISFQGALGGGYQWSARIADGPTVSISPSFALMASDHWLVGLAMGANVYPVDDLNSDGTLGPFVRYYFNPSSTGNNYFLGSSLDFQSFRPIEGITTITTGFNRFITSNLSVEATLGYSFNESDLRNTVNAGFGLRSFLSKDDWSTRRSVKSSLVQGSWLLGASDVGLVLNGDFISTRLAPNFGYFLTDRFVLGLNSSFSYSSDTRNESNRFNDLVWAAQPFVRYYFPNQGQRLIPFGQFGLGYTSSNIESENRFELNSNRLSTHARLGANLFLASNVAFEFSLDLRRSFDSKVDNTYNNEFLPEGFFLDFEGTLDDRELELGLNMGIQFFLFRKE